VRFVASAATSQFAAKWRLQEGDIVSFKHHGFLFATGKPKLAALYRVRSDISWDQVVSNWSEQKRAPNGILT